MIALLHDFLPQGAERALVALGGVFGGALSFAFGDVMPLLIWMLIFVVADFASGLYAAWHTSSYQSKRLFIGVLKKSVMFWIVALAHGIDVTLQHLLDDLAIFQSITICAYAAGEFGSVIENLERAGLGGAIPPVLRRLVRSLDEKIEGRAGGGEVFHHHEEEKR